MLSEPQRRAGAASQRCLVRATALSFMARLKVLIRGCLLCAAFLGADVSLDAQPAPKLSSISQEWLQRGSSVEVTLSGENLAGVTNLLFSGDAGFTATLSPREKPSIKLESSEGGISPAETSDNKTLSAKISVSPEATLRPREVRAVSPAVISNPL